MRSISKVIIIRHKIWILAKVTEVAHTLSFYPRVFNFSLLLLYRKMFPRYGPIFKISIDIKLDICKSSRCCTCTLVLNHLVEIELIFALQIVVAEILADFQNYHIWV